MDAPTAMFLRYRDQGDLDALGELFDAVAPRLLSVALHLTGNAADAEDALQATFVVAMRKAGAFDGRQRVVPWLSGILSGEAANVRRREDRRRGTGPLTEVADSQVDEAERRDVVAQLRTHIEALPLEQRQVLLLQLQHGLAPAEIAEVLGVAPGTVRMRLHRGLAALRRVLPASIATAGFAVLAPRGLAAVKANVMAAAPAAATATAATAGAATIGGLAMKKVLFGVLVAATALLVWWAATPPSELPAPAGGAAVEPARAVADQRPADDAGAGEPAAGRTAAVADDRAEAGLEPGRVRVVVRADPAVARGPLVQEVTSSAGSGVPMVDVLVEAWQGARRDGPLDGRMRSARTDANGRTEFVDLEPGAWRFAPVAGGLRLTEPHTLVVEGGGDQQVELHVTVGGTVVGRVVDARGAAVAGADLVIGNRMQQTSQPARLTRVAARSDANGRFSLTHAPLEDYVMARKGGYVASASHPVQQLGSGEVVLVLGPASGSIAGRVVDQDGAGLPGIAVAVQDHDEALRRAPDGSLVGPRLPVVVRTDANGGFVADGLAAGKHTCQVRRLPDAPADAVATVVPGERQYVTLVVRRRAAVFGFVRGRDEQPRPGLYVMLTHADRSSQTAISAGDGSFRFEGVDDEPFELVAMRLATRRQVKRAFDGRTGLQMRVDLVIDDPPPLRVRAVTSSGRSLVGWRVSVDVAGARRDADVRDSGSAIFWTLPDGAHPISLRRAGAPHDAPPIATASGGPGDDVTVTVPATAAPGAAIRGRLVDDLGRPWQQAWAWLSAGPPVAEPSVAPDGSFAFGELGSGRHELRFGAVGAVKSRREVSLGAGEQHDLGDVVLPRGATLRVRFRRPDGSAWRGRPPMPWLKRADGTFLTTSNLDYAIDGDEVVVTCIPAGTYVVQRPMGDELVIAPAEVSLSAGVTRHLAFDVRLGRRCWLRFDAGGDDSELAVTVRTDQGDPVLTERVSAPEEGRYSVRALLPVGRVVIEARSEAGRRYRREYDVTAAQQAHVDVMVPGLR